MSRPGAAAAGRIAAAAITGALLAATSAPADAAFESPAADPVGLSLGSAAVAWTFEGALPGGESIVFGRPPRSGVRAATLRWEEVPGLAKDAVAAWIRRGPSLLTVKVSRLAAGAYSETALLAEVARPAEDAGWGWALAAGREAWRAGAAGASGWIVSGHVGVAPRPGLRAALRVVERPGNAGGASGSIEVGLSADPLAGWRFGAGYETSRAGGFGRMKIGGECRAGRDVRLRVGLLPSEGTVSAGLGLVRGALGVDVARRSHPRLGTVQSLSVRLGGGR